MKKLSLLVLLAAMALLPGCKKKNRAPDGADVPSGPKTGYKNSALAFRSSATDADGDSVAIRFDWGDGDTSGWSGLVESDASVSDSHRWVLADTFETRAQAKDAAGTASDWSEPFAVAIIGGWTRTFGGAGDEHGQAVVQSADGGYVVAGYADSYGAGSGDAYLIKTDAFGSQGWVKTFGGTEWDACYSVQQTSEGGYILLGASASYRADFWLVKTDADGNQDWAKGFGETGWGQGRSVQQTNDGGYILVGTTCLLWPDSGDIWLIKTDASGNQTWAKTFGGNLYDCGRSVRQTADRGYIVVGSTESFGAGSFDVYLLRTDANGDTLWTRTYGGAADDVGNSVRQTTDCGYIVTGTTASYGAGKEDIWLIRTDANGNVE
jgi:hypothetical protein